MRLGLYLWYKAYQSLPGLSCFLIFLKINWHHIYLNKLPKRCDLQSHKDWYTFMAIVSSESMSAHLDKYSTTNFEIADTPRFITVPLALSVISEPMAASCPVTCFCCIRYKTQALGETMVTELMYREKRDKKYSPIKSPIPTLNHYSALVFFFSGFPMKILYVWA